MYSYLDEAALARLKAHKYSVTGISFLETYLKPRWVKMAQILPLWLAPNAITSIGLAVNMLTCLLLVFYNPDFSEGTHVVPAWAYALCGLGVICYQLLDAFDGIQARRTKSASPLGELFDHGCDAFSTIFIVLSVCVSLEVGTTTTLFSLLLGMSTYYSAHWRAFCLGTMTFASVDVTETQWIVTFIHLTTAAAGPAIWGTVLFEFYTLRSVVIAITWIGSLITVVRNFEACLNDGVGPEGTTVAESSVLSPAIPITLSVLVCLYISNFPCFVLAPWLALGAMGLMLVKPCLKVVVAHMTKSPMELLDGPTLIMPFLVFYLNETMGQVLDSTLLLYIVALFVVWHLGFYISGVIREICAFLNIKCFSIPYPPPEDDASKKTN